MISGGSTSTRRKRNAANYANRKESTKHSPSDAPPTQATHGEDSSALNDASAETPSTDPPKKRYKSRKRSRLMNFGRKSSSEQNTRVSSYQQKSHRITQNHTSTPVQYIATPAPVNRRTRSSRPYRTHVPVDRFAAKPATPTKRGPSFFWSAERAKLQSTIRHLRSYLKVESDMRLSLRHGYYKLMHVDLPTDRPNISDPPRHTPSILSANDLHQFITTTLLKAPDDAMAQSIRP